LLVYNNGTTSYSQWNVLDTALHIAQIFFVWLSWGAKAFCKLNFSDWYHQQKWVYNSETS
jgi:hypothetical protein